MKAHDTVDLAARNLRESVLRNSLTTVGIAVGVASLVAMLSLGIGLQQLASRRLARSGLFNTVVVSNRDFDHMGPRDRQLQANTPPRPLDDDARTAIGRVPHVTEVFPELRFMAEVRQRDKARFVPVAALPPSARDTDAFENLQGAFFSSPSAHEAILQGEFARELNPDLKALLGQDITIQYAERGDAAPQDGSADDPSAFSVIRRELTLKIVGIVESDPGLMMRPMGRGRVFFPLQVAESLNVMLGSDLREMVRSNYRGRAYMALTAKIDNPKNVQTVEDAVRQMGFSTFSLLDAARNLRRFFTILDLFLGIFGSLALAVALLGIVNTLIMAILERRREIGIMKAVGAADSDIRALFFAEAGVMGLLGGMVGVGFGWTIGRVINAGTNIYLRRQQLPAENFWSVPWWLVLAAIVFSILVSLISGMYPAGRAARLDPVQALRYE